LRAGHAYITYRGAFRASARTRSKCLAGNQAHSRKTSMEPATPMLRARRTSARTTQRAHALSSMKTTSRAPPWQDGTTTPSAPQPCSWRRGKSPFKASAAEASKSASCSTASGGMASGQWAQSREVGGRLWLGRSESGARARERTPGKDPMRPTFRFPPRDVRTKQFEPLSMGLDGLKGPLCHGDAHL